MIRSLNHFQRWNKTGFFFLKSSMFHLEPNANSIFSITVFSSVCSIKILNINFHWISTSPMVVIDFFISIHLVILQKSINNYDYDLFNIQISRDYELRQLKNSIWSSHFSNIFMCSIVRSLLFFKFPVL